MAKVTRLPARSGGALAAAPCFVRVTNADHRGFIEFQFSIGDPTLYLEMTLPPAAFAEFCATHRAQHLAEDAACAVDASVRRWRFGADDEE